jgi:hypothetical protein
MTPEQLERRRKSKREYMARVRAANPKKDRERQREWRRNNPDKYKEYCDKYYAAVKDTPEFKAKRKQQIVNFTEEQRVSRRVSGKAYMARQRKSSPEFREKQRALYYAWKQTDGYIFHLAKRACADVMGASLKEIPEEIAQVKFVHLKLKRAICALA